LKSISSQNKNKNYTFKSNSSL